MLHLCGRGRMQIKCWFMKQWIKHVTAGPCFINFCIKLPWVRGETIFYMAGSSAGVKLNQNLEVTSISYECFLI